MQVRMWTSSLVTVVGLTALLATGCGPESTGAGLVTVRLSAARSDAIATTMVVTQDVATAGAVGGVTGLTVALDSVQLQSSGSEGWQTAAVSEDLDLMALPSDVSNALELGTVNVGTGPCQVRLFVSKVTITFDHEVVAGGQTYPPDTPIEGVVRVPSGDQSGLKADGNCDAETDPANVTLVFDVGATVGTTVVTGNGQILLTPVIHVVQH